ncbi:histone-lysine N-methyltransferase SETMAR-like [Colias croceus]|uniref:histone-lysine N-methyltransferase SETMAR-like n=1 Tax=Colias crocea TaxID=72248 RepID=UPI001E27C6DD|nr:histone-lysine N-methyltransferase SETMAR-like [Colias croceus]
MEKEQYRSVIRFLFLDGKERIEIKGRLDAMYGDSFPSIATVKNWFNEFASGRTSVFDEPRPGAPKTAATEENIKKIHDLVLTDRRLKVRELAETVGISEGTVNHILHEELGMRKLSARWVPHLLTPENKRNREFLRRFVAVGETWIHWYTRETKEQSKQWIQTGERAPKKAKTVKSATKVTDTIFWDSQGVVYIDYLEKGKPITGLYYANLLDRFDAELKKKRPHLAKKKVLLHHDNALVHTSAVAMAKLVELCYELLPFPPYSPDLAPGDFFLFPNLKKSLAGNRYGSNQEVIAATKAYFTEFEKTYFSDGLKKLEHRWTKVYRTKRRLC